MTKQQKKQAIKTLTKDFMTEMDKSKADAIGVKLIVEFATCKLDESPDRLATSFLKELLNEIISSLEAKNKPELKTLSDKKLTEIVDLVILFVDQFYKEN